MLNRWKSLYFNKKIFFAWLLGGWAPSPPLARQKKWERVPDCIGTATLQQRAPSVFSKSECTHRPTHFVLPPLLLWASALTATAVWTWCQPRDVSWKHCFRAVVLKRSGGRLKQDLDKDFFKQFRPTHTYAHTRQKNSAVLKLSYTPFQLQQWTNFCTNFSPK